MVSKIFQIPSTISGNKLTEKLAKDNTKKKCSILQAQISFYIAKRIASDVSKKTNEEHQQGISGTAISLSVLPAPVLSSGM